LVAIALACSALLPASAVGSSSGEIIRAEVSADWTSASLAGMAEKTHGCQIPAPGKPQPGEPEPPVPPDSPPWTCGWIPYLTLGATSSSCSSPARAWDSLGESIQVVWVGLERTSVGSAVFDLANVPLDQGAAAPLLCLSVVESILLNRVCIPEISCPPVIGHVTYQLDSVLLEVVPPPPGSPGSRESTPLLPSGQPCRRSKPRHKRSDKKPRIGIGPSIRVAGNAKSVRRCKRG
jgi:hypothetical protein